MEILSPIAPTKPKEKAPRTAALFRQRAGVATLTVIAVVLFTSLPAFARGAPESFADLAEKLLPAVVNISTTQVIEGRSGPEIPQLPPGSPFEDFFKDFFDRGQPNKPNQRKRRATSLGSGFIVKSNGDGSSYVVTNNHVIADADEITVILQDNTRLDAKLVGRDIKTDLAVLKVKSKKNLPSVSFGNSDISRVGDWVVAIGNPFGLGGTVTAGIISARSRDINSGPYDDFIQTDASINRGNSGGPMFNLNGEVIGINTAIFSPSGGSVGIGFAIPSASASPVVEQLIKSGQVRRGWLGVHIQAVTEEIAETLGLKKASGALVANVIKDGPAMKAGIKPGDVILKFNGRIVPEMRKLPRIVADTGVGKNVDVVLWRNGKEKKIKVSIGKLEEEKETKVTSATKAEKEKFAAKSVKELGLSLSALTPSVRERFKLSDEAKGVVVTEVEEDGVAARKGLRPGDLIVEVSQLEVTKPSQVVGKVKEALKDGRKSVLVLVEGQGGLRFVALRVNKG